MTEEGPKKSLHKRKRSINRHTIVNLKKKYSYLESQRKCENKSLWIFHFRIGITITSVGPECKIIQDGCTQRAVLKSDISEACSTVTAIGR